MQGAHSTPTLKNIVALIILKVKLHSKHNNVTDMAVISGQNVMHGWPQWHSIVINFYYLYRLVSSLLCTGLLPFDTGMSHGRNRPIYLSVIFINPSVWRSTDLILCSNLVNSQPCMHNGPIDLQLIQIKTTIKYYCTTRIRLKSSLLRTKQF